MKTLARIMPWYVGFMVVYTCWYGWQAYQYHILVQDYCAEVRKLHQ